MTEPREDHRVMITRCGHPAKKGVPYQCEGLKQRGECPDKRCLGWVD
jgi:hypothetical protein